MKQARKSFGPPYDCKFEWPEDCFVQCGEKGIVLSGGLEKVFASDSIPELADNLESNYSYTTAFFEAFPNNPNTFIRGEGKTVEEAELRTWEKYLSYQACAGHEFEAGKYDNGAGICKHCKMFGSKAIPAYDPCFKCGTPTWYSKDNQNRRICGECYYTQEHEDLDKAMHYLYTKESWENFKEQRKYKCGSCDHVGDKHGSEVESSACIERIGNRFCLCEEFVKGEKI